MNYQSYHLVEKWYNQFSHSNLIKDLNIYGIFKDVKELIFLVYVNGINFRAGAVNFIGTSVPKVFSLSTAEAIRFSLPNSKLHQIHPVLLSVINIGTFCDKAYIKKIKKLKKKESDLLMSAKLWAPIKNIDAESRKITMQNMCLECAVLKSEIE